MTVFHLIYTIFNNFFQLIDIALTRIIYLYELIISHNENIHNRNLLLQSALTLGLFIYVVYAHARNLRPSSAATRGGGTNSYCSYCWRQVRAKSMRYDGHGITDCCPRLSCVCGRMNGRQSTGYP